MIIFIGNVMQSCMIYDRSVSEVTHVGEVWPL